MKKIFAAALVAGLFASTGAMASGGGGAASTTTTVNLPTNGYVAVGNVTTNVNLARQYNFVAAANRAGVVKNDFEGTLSANVIAGINEDATNNRIGVVAGSNKGRNVFTGSSVGGSVSQCGAQVAKTTTNLGASLVVSGSLDLSKANGCNR